jgi:type I restriction enzyme S subunit
MNAERLLALYERVAEAPDAIACLRRFILDLAVRGKLVPQDPQDEPASELLKRIAQEKARLVKAGEITRDKPLPQLTDSNRVFELPSGWNWARLGDLSKMVTSGSRDWAKHYSNEGAIFVRMGNLSKDHYRLRLDHIQRVKAPSDGEGTRTRLEPGDILISITGDVGMLGLIPEGFGEAYINQHTAMVRPIAEMKGRYLAELFRSPFAQGQFNEPQRGIKNSFRLTDVTQFVVPLPPLAEQHRIVAKVDELMALCDQLEAARQERESRRDRLAAASLARLNAPDPETFQSDARFTLNALPALTTRPNQIKQLRQTILNLAVRGKLMPQDPQDEPASELLTRIVRCDETGPKKRLLNEKPAISTQTSLHVLPPSWVWTRLDVLAKKITDGEHLSPIKTNDGMKLLTAAHVTSNGLSLDNPQFVSVEDGNRFRNRCDPKRGDLLICSRGTIGRCAIVDTDEVFCLMGSVILLRPPSELSPRYLLAYLSTETTQKLMQGMSGATAVKALYLKDIKNCPVPIPPLAEQHRIVAKVDELMALCDRLEASLTTADQTRTRLLEATLAEALAPASITEMEPAE